MFDALKSLFAPQSRPAGEVAPGGAPPLQLAACAVLLEVAHADDEFTEDERRHIEEVVMRHFDLDHESAQRLMAVAEEARREAVDLHQFVSVLKRHYDEGQRVLMAELVWRIVYADGKLSEHESQLARKLAYMLELPPAYLSEARRRVQGDDPSKPRQEAE